MSKRPIYSAGPATGCQAITPDDSNDLPYVCIGFILGTGGVCKITDANGNTSSPKLPTGYNPIAIRRFWSTGTAAGVLSDTIHGLS